MTLGFLVGFIVGSLAYIVARSLYGRYKRPAVRLAKQLHSKARTKGAILETDKTETEEWLQAISENKNDNPTF